MIHHVTLDRLEVPLSDPYRLSTITLESFDVILVRVETDDGSVGLGEVTVLEGYSNESGDRAWENLRRVAETLPGTDPDHAVSRVESELDGYPFSTTGLASAIETATEFDWPAVETPVVGICSAEDAPTTRSESVGKQVASGLDTVKVKIGFDPEEDAAVVGDLVESTPDGVSFRVDANQGYTPAEARRFLSLAPTTRLDHLEQPLPVDCLNEHARLAAESSVDVVLDEDVSTADDLAAVDSADAADGVKFKLMKCGSLERARRLIEDALSRDFEVVFGNGVQSDVGCLLEAVVWTDTDLVADGEFNGWRKQSVSTLQTGLGFRDGALEWDGDRPRLDETVLDRYRIASARVGRT